MADVVGEHWSPSFGTAVRALGLALGEELPEFNTVMYDFQLSPQARVETGMWNHLACRVVGRVEEGSGLALVLRSTASHVPRYVGFYMLADEPLLPGDDLFSESRGVRVFQGRATWPDLGQRVDWPTDVFDMTEPPVESNEFTRQAVLDGIYEFVKRPGTTNPAR